MGVHVVASEKIVCIGCGPIGRSWAVAFLRAGYRVTLYDNSAAVARAAAPWIVAAAKALDELDAPRRPWQPDAVTIADTLSEALRGALYVQENVREDVTLKSALFAEFDRVADAATMFGSSTSGIPGSQFLGKLSISPRCLVVHPTNPPHLIPLTELCATPWTSPETTTRVSRLLAGIGQEPVEIRQEIPGFVLNRLQAAVIAESLRLVERDVISALDLEKVIKHGLGLRWAFMGPFETGHLNADGGYLDYMTKYGPFWSEQFASLGLAYAVSPPVVRAIDEALRRELPASIQAQQQRRDRIIAQLRAHLRAQAAREAASLPA